MNKLNKILVCIIIILVIALSIITYQYFKMKNIAKENFNNYTNALSEIYKLQYPDSTVE